MPCNMNKVRAKVLYHDLRHVENNELIDDSPLEARDLFGVVLLGKSR
jgi:hypothetical protein